VRGSAAVNPLASSCRWRPEPDQPGLQGLICAALKCREADTLRVDDGRVKPSRTNSTEGPIDAFDQKTGCRRVETVGTGRSRVLAQRRDTPDNEKWSGRWESNPQGRRLWTPENKWFGAIAETKCDWRVNFRGTWGHVGIREPMAVPSPATPVTRFAILPIQNRDIGRGPPRSEFQWEGWDFVRQSTKYSVGLAKAFSLQYYQS
jgi:hypothetical protein